jgi:hypothetical protein
MEEKGMCTKSEKLRCWFNLSYASWLTIPRVLMEAMSIEWQDKMADLLAEYDETFQNKPDLETIVQVREKGRMIRTPEWLINYRHPDFEAIERLRNPGHEGHFNVVKPHHYLQPVGH